MREFEEVNKLFHVEHVALEEEGDGSGRGARASRMRDPFHTSTWCKLCDAPKPPRAHHCHVTNKCVLLFDHFCPWVSNSIGLFNYRFFYLFMFWIWVGSTYALAVTYLPFRHSMADKLTQGRTGITFTFVCACSIFLAVGGMLGWQTYLIASAQTTIEVYQNRYMARNSMLSGRVWRNPFDLGLRRNWAIVFGPSAFPLAWAIPFGTPGPLGNGLQWPTTLNPDPVYETNLEPPPAAKQPTDKDDDDDSDGKHAEDKPLLRQTVAANQLV
jgi:DHHC palmitoyltransferase